MNLTEGSEGGGQLKEEAFYPSEEVVISYRYLNISNYARRLAQCERVCSIFVVDACRDLVTDTLAVEDSERPFKDLGQTKGASVILYASDMGQRVDEWVPNPANKLYYCEGTFEFLKHIDKCWLHKLYGLGEVLKGYKYHLFSE